MKNLDNINKKEKEFLLKFPAYISLLAANWNGELNKVEKKCAVHFSHIKTYSCAPMLNEFYKKADKVLERNIVNLDNELPKGKKERDMAIKI